MLFLSCKAKAGVKLAKMEHGPHSSKLVVIYVVLLLFVLFCVLFVFVFYVLFMCKCVLYYCHRVLTQLQLTNISYHILNTFLWVAVCCVVCKLTEHTPLRLCSY